MASSIKKIDIDKVGSTIQVLVINTVKPNAPECFALSGIKSVIPTLNFNYGRNGIDTNTTYPFTDQLMITINFDNEHSNPPIRFDIQTVNNQAGWTADFAGLSQAATDICGWITASGGGGVATATEATLLLLLAAAVSLNTPVNITPTLVRVTNAVGSPITAGKRRVSFFNSGSSDGVILGSVIKPGESIPFESGDLRDGLGAISYDGTGTELVITTVG